MDPVIHPDTDRLAIILDQILVTARIEAETKNQKIEVRVSPELMVTADQQAFHSALSNLIQNALKFTPQGGKVQVRGIEEGENLVIEVEDECGGIPSGTESDLFAAFEQRNENREGLGLGLTIAERAIALNHGTIEVRNLPEMGCIFKITLPKHVEIAKPAGSFGAG